MPREIKLTGPWAYGWSRVPDVSSVELGRRIEPPTYPQIEFVDIPNGPLFHWYQRVLRLPEVPIENTRLLRFGAAHYRTDVWIDGAHAGSHKGGYTPFEIALPIEKTHADVIVRVWATTHETQAAWIPRGSQPRVGDCSGIWQPVSIITRPLNAIVSVQTDPLPTGGGVRLMVERSGTKPGCLQVEIRSMQSKKVLWQGSANTPDGGSLEVTASDFEFEPWSPDRPTLYQVWLGLNSASTTDERSFALGFRRISCTSQDLRLNGMPVYIRGIYDDDFDPTTGHAFAGDERVESRLLTLKQRGFNLVRCRGKIPDPRYLDAADRVGLLVWYEVPGWYRPHEATAVPEEATDEIAAMLRDLAVRDSHHPSLAIRSIAPTPRSVEIEKSSADRRTLRRLTNIARESDSTSLVVDTAVDVANTHLDTDLVDVVLRPLVSEDGNQFAARVQATARNTPALWSRTDASMPPRRPVIARIQPEVSPEGSIDEDWGNRFHKSPIRSSFSSSNALRAATNSLQQSRRRERLRDLRSVDGLAGYVVGNDQHHPEETPAHADTSIIMRGLPTSVWAGDPLNVKLSQTASMGLSGPFGITWSFDGNVVRLTETIIDDPSASHDIDYVQLSAPAATHIGSHKLQVSVTSNAGTHVDQATVLVIPESLRVLGQKLRVFVTGARAPDQIGTLANAIAEIGCTVLTAPTRTRAVIAVGGGITAMSNVQAGMPGLVLAEAKDNEFLPSRPRPMELDTTTVDWIHPTAIPGLTIGPLLGREFSSVAPQRRIPALDGLDVSDVLMGTFRGALGDEAALTAQACYGDGKAVVTTLRLVETSRTDPLARAILVTLLRYVISDACSPQTRIVAPSDTMG